MIYEIELGVETYFQANWVGEIQYSNTQKHPNTDTWIFLEVVPVFVDSHVGGCVTESHVIYVTVYDSNKVKSAKLADRVIQFLRGVKIEGNTVGAWRPVAQGEIYDGLHSRKLSFPVSVTH